MDIEDIEKRLNNISDNLKHDDQKKIIQTIKENEHFEDLNIDEKNKINNEYYNYYSEYEKIYQKNNDEYKKLISQFSKSYLEICDFYVGPELPRKTYLDSKKDVEELFSLFIFGALFEPYIEAYYNKYCN